jgi:hypothetical protein
MQGQPLRGASFDRLRTIGGVQANVGAIFPPGRRKQKTASPGGSDLTEVGRVVATATAPDRPKQGQPPRGAEGDTKCANVGAIFPPGRPKEKTAPSGGSALHAVKSVGVRLLPAANIRILAFPSGLAVGPER